jgi:AraC family transcriptional regulator
LTQAALRLRRLDAGVSLAELEHVTGLSRFHFARLFANYVGEAPGRYGLRFRLCAAYRALAASEPVDVRAVGRAVGYRSPAAFSRAFAREFGVCPSSLREGPGAAPAGVPASTAPRDDGPAPSSLRDDVPGGREPELVEVPPQTLAGVGRRGYSRLNFCAVASSAFRALEANPLVDGERVGPETFGVLEGCSAFIDERSWHYVAGVAVPDGFEAPPSSGALVARALAGGTYVSMVHEGPYEHVWQTWNWLSRAWLPASGWARRDAPAFEVNEVGPGAARRPADYRTRVMIPVVAGGAAAR